MGRELRHEIFAHVYESGRRCTTIPVALSDRTRGAAADCAAASLSSAVTVEPAALLQRPC